MKDQKVLRGAAVGENRGRAVVEGGLPASEPTPMCELEAGRVQVVYKGNVRC